MVSYFWPHVNVFLQKSTGEEKELPRGKTFAAVCGEFVLRMITGNKVSQFLSLFFFLFTKPLLFVCFRTVVNEIHNIAPIRDIHIAIIWFMGILYEIVV